MSPRQHRRYIPTFVQIYLAAENFNLFRFAEVEEEGSSAGVPECSWLRPQGASRPSAGPHRGRKTFRGYSQLCQPEAKGRVGNITLYAF